MRESPGVESAGALLAEHDVAQEAIHDQTIDLAIEVDGETADAAAVQHQLLIGVDLARGGYGVRPDGRVRHGDEADALPGHALLVPGHDALARQGVKVPSRATAAPEGVYDLLVRHQEMRVVGSERLFVSGGIDFGRVVPNEVHESHDCSFAAVHHGGVRMLLPAPAL